MLNSRGFEIFGLMIAIVVALVVAAAAGYVFISENDPLGKGGEIFFPSGAGPTIPQSGIIPTIPEVPLWIINPIFQVWFSNATVKIHKEATPENILHPSVALNEIGKISAAGDEYESFQINVSLFDDSGAKFKVSIGDFQLKTMPGNIISKSNVDLYKVEFVDVRKYFLWPDRLNGKRCTSFGFGSGNLGCTSNCTYDTSACSYVPVSKKHKIFLIAGKEYYYDDYLDRLIEKTKWFVDPEEPVFFGNCGSGTLELWEVCDGSEMGTSWDADKKKWNCTHFGFGSGTLKCTSTCNFDVSECILKPGQPDAKCGNEVIETGETCDGTGYNVVMAGDNDPSVWLPDPLVPIANGESGITVQGHETQPIWFTVHVPKGSISGLYEGTVTIEFESGATATKTIELEVYDFDMPDEAALKTLFGLGNIAYHFAENPDPDYIYTEEYKQKYNKVAEKYFEYFKRSRLSPGVFGVPFTPAVDAITPEGTFNKQIRYTIDSEDNLTLVPESLDSFDEMAEKYLKSEPGKRTFNTFLPLETPWKLQPPLGDTEADNEKWIQLYEKTYAHIKDKDWAGKAVYYSAGEPNAERMGNPNYVAEMTRWLKLVHTGAPDLKIQTKAGLWGGYDYMCDYGDPNGSNHPEARNAIIYSLAAFLFPYSDNYEYEMGYRPIDVWMLNTRGFIPMAVPLIRERQKNNGEEFWFYDTKLAAITIRYPNVNEYPIKGKEGIANRVMPWQLWKIDGKGLLIYATNSYHAGNNPWKNPNFVDAPPKPGIPSVDNGTAALFYPPCGKDLPGDKTKCEGADNETIVPSQRIELIREGIEDFDKFAMLKKLIDESDNAALKYEGQAALDNAMSLVTYCYYDFNPNPQLYYDAMDRISKAIVALK